MIAWRSLTALLFAAACRKPPAVVPQERAPAHPAVVISRPGVSREALQGGLPDRVGVAGSTRGSVACGSSRCSVPGQICVLLDSVGSGGVASWRCLSSDHELDGERSYACDDASDCTDGQACCLGFQSASLAYACSARSGAGANCALESCVVGGGAPCPAGQVCRAGACAPSDARATCLGGQRCPLSAPICLWAKGVATCASDATSIDTGELPLNELRLSCASPADCGGGLRCCTNTLGNATSCRVNCDAANNLELCVHDADCLAAGSGAGKNSSRCLAASAGDPGHFPAWVRLCQAR